MKANRDSIKENDVIIFKVDEYRDGRMCEFDGNVLWVRHDGVEVIYLSGFRSRNDLIPWKNIIAKVDKSLPWIKLEDAPFSGNFLVFDKE